MATSCPKCKSSPCYVSFMGKIECSNIRCEHYSRELYPPKGPSTLPAPPDNDDDLVIGGGGGGKSTSGDEYLYNKVDQELLDLIRSLPLPPRLPKAHPLRSCDDPDEEESTDKYVKDDATGKWHTPGR